MACNTITKIKEATKQRLKITASKFQKKFNAEPHVTGNLIQPETQVAQPHKKREDVTVGHLDTPVSSNKDCQKRRECPESWEVVGTQVVSLDPICVSKCFWFEIPKMISTNRDDEIFCMSSHAS
jgi:hypothetical protein